MSLQKPLIGLDTRGLEPNFKAHFGRGTGRYVAALTRELSIPKTKNVEIQSLGSKDLKLNALQNKILSLSPLGKTTLECQYFFPRNVKCMNLDLIHFFSHGDAPAYPLTDQIVSVLDLIPLKFPDLYKDSSGGLRFRFARFLENKAIRAAKGIIAISESTKRDLISILGVEEKKIIVTPLGVDSKFFTPQASPEARKAVKLEVRSKFKFKSSDKILLYVGGIDPRKNIKFLLEVLKSIRNDPKGKDVVLALVGPLKKDKHYPDLVKAIEKLQLREHILELGFLSDEDLLSMMIAADLFVFPSLYEGFGLPILEAFACGLDVIAGHNSSIPEVMGSNGIMIKDSDKFAWGSAILEKLNQAEDNSKTSELINKRIIHAQSFSWRKTADLTLSAYDEFLRSK